MIAELTADTFVAEAIRRWRTWAQSTGPKTAEGKARTARNGYRGGKREKFRALMRELNALLSEQRVGLKGGSSVGYRPPAPEAIVWPTAKPVDQTHALN